MGAPLATARGPGRYGHCVVGFEYEADAQRFWDALRSRLEEFALSLHPDKTRLMVFGRYAADRRAKAGLGKPETFKFLGFVFICGKSRRAKFVVYRKSRRDRMRAKLKEIREELRKRMHQPIPEQGRWLAQVGRGYFAYHAVPTNGMRIGAFRYHVVNLWLRTLRRRSQNQETGQRLASSTTHPSPLAQCAFRRQILKVRTGCLNWPRPDMGGGAVSNHRPYRDPEKPVVAVCATLSRIVSIVYSRCSISCAFFSAGTNY
jgi:hypothetical protein